MKLLLAMLALALSACSSSVGGRDVPAACATNSQGGVLCRFDDPTSGHSAVVYFDPAGGVTAAASDATGYIVDLQAPAQPRP